MCLASCITTQFGLWYKSTNGGFDSFYPNVNLTSSFYKHYVTTWDTATDNFAIYIDGVQKNTTTSTVTPFTYTNIAKMSIGQNACECITEYSPIRLSSVQIYNRALTSTEIVSNYYAFKPKYNLS